MQLSRAFLSSHNSHQLVVVAAESSRLQVHVTTWRQSRIDPNPPLTCSCRTLVHTGKWQRLFRLCHLNGSSLLFFTLVEVVVVVDRKKEEERSSRFFDLCVTQLVALPGQVEA